MLGSGSIDVYYKSEKAEPLPDGLLFWWFKEGLKNGAIRPVAAAPHRPYKEV